jgi:hypothetical protein
LGEALKRCGEENLLKGDLVKANKIFNWWNFFKG